MKSFDDVFWSAIRHLPKGWHLKIRIGHSKHFIMLRGPGERTYHGKHGTSFASQIETLIGIAKAEHRKLGIEVRRLERIASGQETETPQA